MNRFASLGASLSLLAFALPQTALTQTPSGSATTGTRSDNSELVKRVAAVGYPPEAQARHMDEIVERAMSEIRETYRFADEAPPFAKDWIEEHLTKVSQRFRGIARKEAAPRIAYVVHKSLANRLTRMQLLYLDSMAQTPKRRDEVHEMVREIYEYDPKFLKAEQTIVGAFVEGEGNISRRLRANVRDVLEGRIINRATHADAPS